MPFIRSAMPLRLFSSTLLTPPNISACRARTFYKSTYSSKEIQRLSDLVEECFYLTKSSSSHRCTVDIYFASFSCDIEVLPEAKKELAHVLGFAKDSKPKMVNYFEFDQQIGSSILTLKIIALAHATGLATALNPNVLAQPNPFYFTPKLIRGTGFLIALTHPS